MLRVQSPMLVDQAGKDCRLRHNVNATGHGLNERSTLVMTGDVSY